jgi:hypothetical protein
MTLGLFDVAFWGALTDNEEGIYSIAGMPSLDLRFASTKSLADVITGQNLITYSRSGPATIFAADGTLQTIGENVPRFEHDPATGLCLGLLLEEARTNLILNSAAPASQTVTVAARAYALSFYGTGSIVLSGAHSATLAGTAAFPSRSSLVFTPSAGSLTLTITGTVQFANLEAGASTVHSWPSSWIPTAGETATRGRDIATISGANFSQFFVQNTGTTYMRCQPVASIATQPFFVGVDAGSGINFRGFSRRANLGSRSTALADSIEVNGPTWASGMRKIAGTWVPNDCVLADSGAIAGTDTSTASPLSVVNTMEFGPTYNTTSGAILNRVCYWGSRLSNAVLQSITS